MKKALLISLAGSILVGCANAPEKIIINHSNTSELDHRSYIHSVETIEYGNKGRAGAAVHQPGYVHSLSNRRHVYDVTPSTSLNADSSSVVEEQSVESVADQVINSIPAGMDEPLIGGTPVTENRLPNSNSLNEKFTALEIKNAHDGVVPMSMYDYQNWERFCNEGKGLGKGQIVRMKNTASTQMPKDIQHDCKRPK